MTQIRNTINYPLLKETPATTGFISHLACNLFFMILLSVSLYFTYWSVQLQNQIDPAALQNVGITSLEQTITADGEMKYYVAYTVNTLNNTESQAVSYQRKRIPAALFYELQNNSSMAIRISPNDPSKTEIVSGTQNNLPIIHTIIPMTMILIGLMASLLSAFLLVRSLEFGIESITLNRYGVMTYGVIANRQTEKFKNREMEYKLVYQFTPNHETEPVRAEQAVPFSRFRVMQVGEVVQVRYHRTRPEHSRIEF